MLISASEYQNYLIFNDFMEAAIATGELSQVSESPSFVSSGASTNQGLAVSTENKIERTPSSSPNVYSISASVISVIHLFMNALFNNLRVSHRLARTIFCRLLSYDYFISMILISLFQNDF